MHYEDALSQYRMSEYADALSDLEKAMNLAPNADMHYLEGMIYETKDQPLRAASAYEACIKYDETYSEAIFQKALIYMNYGDPKQAIKDFSTLISGNISQTTRGIYFQIDESGSSQNQVMSIETMRGKLYYYRAQAYMKTNEVNRAIDDYQASLTIDAHSDYYIGLGLAYITQNDTQKAKFNFKEAISLDRSNQLAWYNLALIDPQLTIPADIISDEEGGALVSLLAERAMENEEYSAAITYFNYVIKRNSLDALSYINRGRAKTKIGKYEEARSDFNQAKKINPKRKEAFYLIGNAYFLENNHEGSLAYYDQYLALVPDDALIWYNAAMAHLELDQKEEACLYLSRASTYGMVQADRWKLKYCDD
ncbi:MAG: tetratricopeptide repeat protein [Cyclobacteriaceae bacterium]